MISENLSASCGAKRCHITCVSENPCNSSSGGPLPPVRAKMRPAEVLIHSEPKPGKRSAKSGMRVLLRAAPSLQTLFATSNFVCRCRAHVVGLCHRVSPTSKKPEERHVDR